MAMTNLKKCKWIDICLSTFLPPPQTMLSLIKDRLTRSVLDDVMEVAWSTMWNVTDETAINCKRFLDGRGMEYFLRCLNVCTLFQYEAAV